MDSRDDKKCSKYERAAGVQCQRRRCTDIHPAETVGEFYSDKKSVGTDRMRSTEILKDPTFIQDIATVISRNPFTTTPACLISYLILRISQYQFGLK